MEQIQRKKNVMVDLETLGTTPGCVVLSIGACTFDEGGIGKTFYAEIDSVDSEAMGLFTNEATLAWWAKQSGEATALLERCANGGSGSVITQCTRFIEFLREHCTDEFRIWGNGAAFDEPILGELLKVAGSRPPWKYYNSRCYRTLHAIGRANGMPETPFNGLKHHALDDALHQAGHSIAVANHLRIKI